MDNENILGRITEGLLGRLGVTWNPDEKYLKKASDACCGAIGILRSVAGEPSLSFERGEDLDLAVTCAWYLIENRRAEFFSDYANDLNWLRAREAFHLGTFEDTGISG